MRLFYHTLSHEKKAPSRPFDNHTPSCTFWNTAVYLEVSSARIVKLTDKLEFDDLIDKTIVFIECACQSHQANSRSLN